MLPQFGDALAGISRHGHHRLALQEGAFDALAHVLCDHFHPLGVYHIGLGDDHQTLLDAQQAEDAQMLYRLGHKAFVGGHHQHCQVDAAGTGQHIFDKPFVAGHVHQTGLGTVIEIQMGEAQINGDTALLFFHQTVGINAGQRLDQQRFAVVNVAGGANNHVFHTASSATRLAI